MNHPGRLMLAGLLLLTVCGCASIGGRAASAAIEGADYSGIYPGLQFDYDFFFDSSSIDEELGENLTPGIKAPLFIIGLIDLPITLAIDTLLLPFDLLFWLTDSEGEDE